MQSLSAALVVGLVLILVLLINAVLFAIVRRGKDIDFGYYRLMSRTLRDARTPLTRQYEEIDELARLVAPYRQGQPDSGAPSEPAPSLTPD